jgi:uncharacterized membrane protein
MHAVIAARACFAISAAAVPSLQVKNAAAASAAERLESAGWRRPRVNERLIPVRQTWAAILALILASLLSCALVAVRAYYAGTTAYLFFFWNLFLAWVPVGAALVFYGLAARQSRAWALLAAAAVVWLLFFPNAPYIVTDIVHLREIPPVPYWYDIVCVMAFAQTGLFLGYLSLYLMQEVIRAWMGRLAGWLFALTMLGLSGLGVYLGRFLRWNSWDALVDPIGIMRGVARVANPWNDATPLAFSTTFFAFSLVCYLIVYSFAHLHGWVQKASSRPV